MANVSPMSEENKNNTDDENLAGKSAKKGAGDPVQRAAREARLKKSLRDNLRRRKMKARSAASSDSVDKE